MNRRLLSVLAVLVIGTCISAKAAEPYTDNDTDNEFNGKIVYVQMVSNEKFVLENVKVTTKGRESFLAGRGFKRAESNSRHEWWEGLPVRLNLRSVVSYFPMTTEQWRNVIDR